MKSRLCIGLIVLCLALCAVSGQEVPKETFTMEEVLSPPYPWGLVSAAEADRIAWIFYEKGERNVWTAAAPDFKPVNLTGYKKDEVFELPEVYLSNDGKTAVYIKNGRPNNEGWVTNSDSSPVRRRQEIWAVRTSGGKPWLITEGNNPVLSPDGRWVLVVEKELIHRFSLEPPRDPAESPGHDILFHAAGRNDSPRYSPDGRMVAFVSRRTDHSFIGVYDIEKKLIRWIAPGVDNDTDPWWTADSERIVFVRRPGLQYGAQPSFRDRGAVNLSFLIGNIEKGNAREIWRTPREKPRYYSFRNFMLTPSERILFTAEADEWNHVYSLGLSGGEPVDLTPGKGMIEHLGLSRDGKTLIFSSNHGDIHGRHIWKVQTDGEVNPVQLTSGATIGTYPVSLASGAQAAFLHATSRHPTSIATVSADGGAVKVVAPEKLPAEYPMDRLVEPKLVILKAEDGTEVPCQLFLPRGAKEGDNLPGVVYTHGGPIRQMLLGWHYMEFYSEAYGINQYFANHGYAVISINYRSGIGYGRSFRNAPNTGMAGAAEYQDILAGVRYLQSRPEVDPERIGKWGLSYGGLLTAMSLARNSDIFKVGVDMAGVHDWSQMGWGRLNEAGRKIARQSSPVADVKNWKSPVLFIHGDDDRNVPFQQTTDIVQKLRAKGDVHIELMIAPDEPHEFMLYKNRMDAYNRTFEFINRFIGK
ncbi:MAG: prolyl oligopeptidase family serine peptidase [Acidobacteria bacterium]|nr:prolyl oligopeptidase family serine peptidase [Acidobacteriota bacterium]